MSRSDPSSQRTDEDERTSTVRIPTTGERIGKYLVLDPLGEGAMGVVVRAYDPDLERSVAIKVVQPSRAQGDRAEASRARLLNEARALARISHPNVVAVYEVGLHEGLIFVAMELIDGVDLQRWLKQRARSWREVVDAFEAAGRGLHQVHLAGLVHRDVKPANILVGSDGRVRIGDFGIARASFELASPVVEGIEIVDGFNLDTTTLTGDGHVVGTLPYMAPEQHLGGDVGPTADQYAFCIALHEALWGKRPFATDMRRMLTAKRAGLTSPPATAHKVPRFLFTIVARGLAPDPARRFATMADLCDALRRDPARRRRRIAAVGAAAVAVTATITGVAMRRGPCDDDAGPLVGVWDPPTRAAVERAFTTSERPWAAAAWAHVAPRLDTYAAEWTAMRRDACEATHVRGEQTAEQLDRRVLCLESRRRGLAAATEVLASGSNDVIDHAFELAGGLRPIAPCGDVIALASAVAVPDDPTLRVAVAEVRTELARARALVIAGRYQESGELARSSTATARALDHPPLVAEALAFEGETLLRVGEAAQARALLEESLWTAIATGHDETAAEAASHLVWLAGQHEHSLAEALRWGELASASLRRRQSQDPHELVLLENAIGASQINAAQFDEGLRTFERALARLADDPTAVARAGTLRHNIAIMWLDRGDFGRAREVLEPAMAELEPLIGREHPRLVAMRGTLAQVLGSAGEHDRAVALFREEVEGLRFALGDDAIAVAYARSNLSIELAVLGQSDESIATAELALATFERIGDATGAASCLDTLADEYLARGAYDAATARFERALEVLTAIYPDGRHPALADPHVGLGRVRLAEGRFEDAIASFERADRITRESEGPSGHMRARALAGKIDALVALGHATEALATVAEQIEVLRAAGDATPHELPRALARRGELLNAAKRFAEALVVLEEAMTLARDRRLDRELAVIERERARALTSPRGE